MKSLLFGVRRRREGEFLTQQDIADLAGVSQKTINVLEKKGHMPHDPDLLKAIAKAYKLPVKKLYRIAVETRKIHLDRLGGSE